MEIYRNEGNIDLEDTGWEQTLRDGGMTDEEIDLIFHSAEEAQAERHVKELFKKMGEEIAVALIKDQFKKGKAFDEIDFKELGKQGMDIAEGAIDEAEKNRENQD